MAKELTKNERNGTQTKTDPREKALIENVFDQMEKGTLTRNLQQSSGYFAFHTTSGRFFLHHGEFLVQVKLNFLNVTISEKNKTMQKYLCFLIQSYFIDYNSFKVDRSS